MGKLRYLLVVVVFMCLGFMVSRSLTRDLENHKHWAHDVPRHQAVTPKAFSLPQNRQSQKQQSDPFMESYLNEKAHRKQEKSAGDSISETKEEPVNPNKDQLSEVEDTHVIKRVKVPLEMAKHLDISHYRVPVVKRDSTQPATSVQDSVQGGSSSTSKTVVPAFMQMVETTVKPLHEPLTLEQCGTKTNTEMDGDVVVPGVGKTAPKATSASECCNACNDTPGCNVWVFCGAERWCNNQCWLKHVEDPRVPPQTRGTSNDWTSGVLLKDYDDGTLDSTVPDPGIEVVGIQTDYGLIAIRLRPDWSQESVDYVRKVVQTNTCTVKCEFYRSEPGFLLQGALRAIVPANKVTTPGPVMEQGMVGWAGGSSGPDFFIYMAKARATSWNHDHTVWGELADDDSVKLVDLILHSAPASVEKPGAMRMFNDNMHFTIKDITAHYKQRHS